MGSKELIALGFLSFPDVQPSYAAAARPAWTHGLQSGSPHSPARNRRGGGGREASAVLSEPALRLFLLPTAPMVDVSQPIDVPRPCLARAEPPMGAPTAANPAQWLPRSEACRATRPKPTKTAPLSAGRERPFPAVVGPPQGRPPSPGRRKPYRSSFGSGTWTHGSSLVELVSRDGTSANMPRE